MQSTMPTPGLAPQPGVQDGHIPLPHSKPLKFQTLYVLHWSRNGHPAAGSDQPDFAGLSRMRG